MTATRPKAKSKIRLRGRSPAGRPPVSGVTGAPTGKAAGGGRSADKSVPQVLSELWSLTVDYGKQEIRDPVRGLGSYLLWGAVSMLLVGLGMVLLAIGGLRALQTETGSTFTGSLSWAPYGIVLVGALIVLGIAGTAMTRGKK